jgi:hypothetical protein
MGAERGMIDLADGAKADSQSRNPMDFSQTNPQAQYVWLFQRKLRNALVAHGRWWQEALGYGNDAALAVCRSSPADL